MVSPQVHQTSVATSGPSVVFQPNNRVTPFQLGLVVKVSGAGAVATVQHTLDDIYTMADPNTSATWINHSYLVSVSGNATAADGNYAFPFTGLRVYMTGTGSVDFIWVQSGIA